MAVRRKIAATVQNLQLRGGCARGFLDVQNSFKISKTLTYRQALHIKSTYLPRDYVIPYKYKKDFFYQLIRVDEPLNFKKEIVIKEMTQNYPKWLKLEYDANRGLVTLTGRPEHDEYYYNFNIQFYLYDPKSGANSESCLILLKPSSNSIIKLGQSDRIMAILVVLLIII